MTASDGQDASGMAQQPVTAVRWPAEWERHEGTWMSWPHNRDTWVEDVSDLEDAFVHAITALSGGEVLHLNARDESVLAHVRARLAIADVNVLADGDATSTTGVRLHRIATNDAWCRDYGPVFVVRGGAVTGLDFRFNAWGGKYPPWNDDDAAAARMATTLGLPTWRHELVLEGGALEGNGSDLVMTTEQCLLNPNRNGDIARADIEGVLQRSLGCTSVLWLGGGVVGDDTDGHIDNLARFIDARTVIVLTEPDTTDINHAPLADNVARLRAWRGADGSALRVIELPEPDALEYDGRRLPASYANFYIGNQVVLLPVYGGARDAEAIRIVGEAFPSRRLVPIDSRVVVRGFGAWHCLTQQVPAFR